MGFSGFERVKKYGFFPSVGSKVIQKPCSAGACTWRNILYRLQVWNLSTCGGQIMRAADCKNLSESPEGVFRQSERDASQASRFLPLGKEKIDSRGKL